MSLVERFHALDTFLRRHQPLWRPRPFTARQLPWEAEYPELAAWLRARTLEQAEADQHEPWRLDAPAPFAQIAEEARQFAQLPELPAASPEPLDSRLSVDVPGRKWEQIRAFSAHLDFAEKPRHWLDWCAGKGHLGRLLARDGTPLTSLEWDAALVDSGRHLSARLGLNARHLQQDVMAADAAGQLDAAHTAVALHACGDLHIRLLELAIARGSRQLAVAPCCYNRIAGEHYRPLSAAAQGSDLSLSRDDLRLPLAETVTAGVRTRRQRDRSMAWRLAFDLLQRHLTGKDEYLPIPSLAPDWLKKDFENYCRDLAQLKALPPPGKQDWPTLEAAGWQRLAEVRNLELIRALFRRPLEIWLLLDRALLLEQNGYRVRLGTFCAPHLSPRNALLLAERK